MTDTAEPVPYVIKASEFIQNKHERQIESPHANSPEWTSDRPRGYSLNRYLVVRELVPKYVVEYDNGTGWRNAVTPGVVFSLLDAQERFSSYASLARMHEWAFRIRKVS